MFQKHKNGSLTIYPYVTLYRTNWIIANKIFYARKNSLWPRERAKEQVTDSRLASEMPQQQVFKLATNDLGWARRGSTAKNKTMNGFTISKNWGRRRKEVWQWNSGNNESYLHEKGVSQIINRVNVKRRGPKRWQKDNKIYYILKKIC